MNFGAADGKPPVHTTDTIVALGDLKTEISVAPLAAQYAEVAVPGDDVKQIIFDLREMADAGAAAGLDIDAFVKIRNRNWQLRDLNGRTELRFCTEKPDEDLESLWFVVSNHTFPASGGSTGRPTIKRTATGAPCDDEWIGTSTLIFTDQASYESTMTWKRNPPDQEGTTVVYEGGGTVEFHYLVFENLGCTVSPKVFTIDPGESGMSVVYSSTPATFGLFGRMNRFVTINCPSLEPFTTGIAIDWIIGTGQVSEDGKTIAETIVTPQVSKSYRFTRR